MRTVFCAVVAVPILIASPGWHGGLVAADRINVEWPSPEFRTLQAAVDAAPDGATVEIASGDHHIDAPIFVVGKRLIIAGAGSGRKGKGRVTRLIGCSVRDEGRNPSADSRDRHWSGASMATYLRAIAAAKVDA